MKTENALTEDFLISHEIEWTTEKMENASPQAMPELSINNDDVINIEQGDIDLLPEASFVHSNSEESSIFTSASGGIIPDNQMHLFPQGSIGILFFRDAVTGKEKHGTAWVASRYCIVTAAHNIFDLASQKPHTSHAFYPRWHKLQYKDWMWKGEQMNVLPGYIGQAHNSTTRHHYDIGVIKLDPAGGGVGKHAAILPSVINIGAPAKQVYQCYGYPGATAPYYQHRSLGNLANADRKTWKWFEIQSNIGTPGTSGGPILTLFNGQPHVCGIAAAGGATSVLSPYLGDNFKWVWEWVSKWG